MAGDGTERWVGACSCVSAGQEKHCSWDRAKADCPSTHMLKHPWHLTSMKKLFGLCRGPGGEEGSVLLRAVAAWGVWQVAFFEHAWGAWPLSSSPHSPMPGLGCSPTCTKRFSLCLDFSSSTGGFSRSISPWSTCSDGGAETNKTKLHHRHICVKQWADSGASCGVFPTEQRSRT
eukprot:scaffold155354_cov17-Tisochrysis_lutea.AAC.1